MAFGFIDITLPDGTTSRFSLEKRQVTVGRSSDSDIFINDTKISRRHLVLLASAEGVRAMDAGSSNGSFIGDVRLPPEQPIPLRDGVVIRVGDARLTFREATAAEVSAAAETSAPRPSARQALTTPLPEAPPPAPAPLPAPVAVSEAQTRSFRPPTPPEASPPGAPPSGPPPTPSPAPRRPEGGGPREVSRYLEYLPAVYRGDDFLGRFLLIFETILQPLDDAVAHMHYYFDARLAPPDLLLWLASWVGLVLDERWPETRRRELIRKAVELYQWRGTRRGLAEMLQLYSGVEVEIQEPGVTGGKASIPKESAFMFRVRVKPAPGQSVEREMLEAIINLEKPAHAGYMLEVVGR